MEKSKKTKFNHEISTTTLNGWQQATRCCSTITSSISGRKQLKREIPDKDKDLSLVNRFLSFDGCNKSHKESPSPSSGSQSLSLFTNYKNLSDYFKKENNKKRDDFDDFKRKLLDDISLWLTGVLGIYGGILSHKYFNRDEEEKCPLQVLCNKSTILLNPVLAGHHVLPITSRLPAPTISDEDITDEKPQPVKTSFDIAAETFEQVSDECYGCLLNQYAMQYRKKKQCKKAFYLFQSAAEYGHVASIYNLGLCYEYGHGVDISLLKAAEFYQQAADKGHIKSMFNIATFHLLGSGGVLPYENKEVGLKYMKTAADQGLAQAQSFVALNHTENSNWSGAFKYFKMAADQQDRTSIYNLAVCFEKGFGVEKDIKQAMKYYHESAEMGDALSQFQIADSYQHGSRGKQINLTESLKWFKLAAENGYHRAGGSSSELKTRIELLQNQITAKEEEGEKELDKNYMYSFLKLSKSLLEPNYELPPSKIQSSKQFTNTDWNNMDNIIVGAL